MGLNLERFIKNRRKGTQKAENYDELYSYLTEFKDKSVQEIAEYLTCLNSRKFRAFMNDLAVRIIPDYFETESMFNYTVDSTLEGRPFPCSNYRCRAKNVERISKFAALYADKMLIHSPIDQAVISSPEDRVNIAELAFGIYLTMQLESIVKAGYVGFLGTGHCLCEKHLIEQSFQEKQAAEFVATITESIIDDFCLSTKCILTTTEDGSIYVSIEGMDAYGSHSEIDVDFDVVPVLYSDLLKDHKSVQLTKQQFIDGGLTALLHSLLEDCLYALSSPYTKQSSYLTVQPSQVAILSSASQLRNNNNFNTVPLQQLVCSFPFVENARIESLLNLREANAESFFVCRDIITSSLKKPIDEKMILELKRDVIDPELHKIDLILKNNKKKLITSTCVEAAISTACITVGNYLSLSPQEIAGLIGISGLTSTALSLTNHIQQIPAKENPMYFLWQLEKRNPIH